MAILLIDHDRPFAQCVGLACLERGIAVRIAENVCEGIRFLVDSPVAAVLVDAGLLRLPAVAQARLFEAVAPGVPVLVLVSEEVPLPERVRYQGLGFQVLSKAFPVEDLVRKAEALTAAEAMGPNR
jgi:DNA-binding response OmpR family regulator